MPLTELTAPLGVKRAAHLLHRATFGPTKSQIDLFATYTPAQAVAQLFGQALPDPVLPIDPETGTEWFLSGTTEANSGDSDLQEFFKGWFIGQMMGTGVAPNLSLAYSAREKVVFFIHTVLTAIQTKIDNSRSLYFQNQLFRQFALDKTLVATVNFKELTKKVCVDNAMLRHESEEGGIIIEGQIEITVDGKRHVLGPGDAYLFDSRLPHRFRNISDEECVIISACTPPYL